MVQRHGIAVHAGSNFARPTFRLVSYLRTRTSVQRTTARVTLIIIAIGLVACGVFCCGVGFVMWKNNRNKKKRARKLAESQPFVQHRYSAVPDMNAGIYTSQGHLQELPNDNESFQLDDARMKNELPSGGSMAHHIDGFAAPPRANTRPVEMPASPEVYQLPTWKSSR
ncbi:hypothetical protein K504DRAFT_498228 [Pleomassaria siparia CBS 279.74]|uniref:Uncharacterized protein n=1 Tax=Pleomassaria siparia CBS 279.74 TaxID=1314801 RepID=A0A6G1KKP8_9PLEO|nr:hypothetical protein K504DRAFT_498228 [Pleomassaria siparia CBS 279.74]